MVRILSLVVVVSLLCAAPAAAAPGDELQQPVSPANGAQLPAGQPVTLTFTCPPYRQSPSQEAPSGGIVGYGVAVSSNPNFTDAFGSEVVRGPGEGQCSVTPRQQGGGGPLTQAGTYYWRVDRFCFCDGTESESGPVSSFTIATPRSTMTLSAPKRPYAGYTFFADLRSDLPDGTIVRVQRSTGGRYVDETPSLPVSGGRLSSPVTVGRGVTRLRYVVMEGPQAGQFSNEVAVRGRRASGWQTTRRDTGRYVEQGKAVTTFRVADRGRTIRDFRAQVSTFCIGGLDPATNRVTSSLAIVKRIRVAPDGRFVAVTTVSKTDIVVSGRLRKGRVTGGRVSIAYPLCSGARSFSAKRR